MSSASETARWPATWESASEAAPASSTAGGGRHERDCQRTALRMRGGS
jgi:hypothetical protein